VAKAIINVCKACALEADGAEASGTRLAAALDALAGPDEPFDICPVDCLAVCTRVVTIALSGPGKWTYVLGGATIDDAPLIADLARRYAGTPDGLVPWRERPDLMKKGVVARVPPTTPSSETKP
jgi:predicted metal-binding protein